MGPRVGLNWATFRNRYDYSPSTRFFYRPGAELGVMGSWARRHFAVQPALTFSQKGYRADERVEIKPTAPPSTGYTYATYHDEVRLNYATLAVNLAYAPAASGQGLHAFAGSYLGLLLGGHREADDALLLPNPQGVKLRTDVAGGPNPLVDDTFHSQRVDAGVQAGLGYRRGQLLFQAGYSRGLRNLTAVWLKASNGFDYRGRPTYSSAFQASFSYLLGSIIKD